MKDKMSGKKTYFTAAAAVLTAFGGYFAGEVDLTVTQRLSALIPEDILCISESGIRTQQDIACILGFGVSCFLVGESFMRSENPGQELENLFSLKNTDRLPQAIRTSRNTRKIL